MTLRIIIYSVTVCTNSGLERCRMSVYTFESHPTISVPVESTLIVTDICYLLWPESKSNRSEYVVHVYPVKGNPNSRTRCCHLKIST